MCVSVLMESLHKPKNLSDITYAHNGEQILTENLVNREELNNRCSCTCIVFVMVQIS